MVPRARNAPMLQRSGTLCHVGSPSRSRPLSAPSSPLRHPRARLSRARCEAGAAQRKRPAAASVAEMAALSLKCNTCGLALRSMREAQDHGEATGHADFSESTEAVLSLVCADCGKPCRSQTECDVHTKRTGHASFVDKTAEAAKPVVRTRCCACLGLRRPRRAPHRAAQRLTPPPAALRRTRKARSASCAPRRPASRPQQRAREATRRWRRRAQRSPTAS